MNKYNNKMKINKFLMKFKKNSKIIIHNNYQYFNKIQTYKYLNYNNKLNKFNNNMKIKN